MPPTKLYFQPGGALSLARPTGEEAPDEYAYPGPSLGHEDGVVAGQNHMLWKAPATRRRTLRRQRVEQTVADAAASAR